MANDISKKTLAVLLVFAIAVSFLGTWVVMSQSPESINVGDQKPVVRPVDASQVQLTVGDGGFVDEGQVSLRIL